MSKLLISSLALLFGATSAMAGPGEPGAPHIGQMVANGKVYVVDPTKPVEIIYKGGYRAHTNTVSVFSVDPDQTLTTNPRYFSPSDVAVDPLQFLPQGSFSNYFTGGSELVFQLTNRTVGGVYYSTNSSNWNMDGRVHAYTSYNDAQNQAFISFEDLDDYNGSDWDYNDYFFLITNVSSTPPPVISVPEPETYAMLLAGLGIVGAVVRRRRK